MTETDQVDQFFALLEDENIDFLGGSKRLCLPSGMNRKSTKTTNNNTASV